MKIYLVTAGDYSDYTVVGVFSTEENAEKYTEELKQIDYPTIAELEVDELVNDKLGIVFGVRIRIYDGRMEYTHICNRVRHPEKCKIQKLPDHILVYSPLSQEHAAKVAIEVRQDVLRERQNK